MVKLFTFCLFFATCAIDCDLRRKSRANGVSCEIFEYHLTAAFTRLLQLNFVFANAITALLEHFDLSARFLLSQSAFDFMVIQLSIEL